MRIYGLGSKLKLWLLSTVSDFDGTGREFKSKNWGALDGRLMALLVYFLLV